MKFAEQEEEVVLLTEWVCCWLTEYRLSKDNAALPLGLTGSGGDDGSLVGRDLEELAGLVAALIVMVL